jgi:hypothetical protein
MINTNPSRHMRKPATRRQTTPKHPVATRNDKDEAQIAPATPDATVLLAKTTKLEQLVALLRQPEGASLAELCTATKWQTHPVRGAIAGSLKHKGHVITSGKFDGMRRYQIVTQA